MKRVSEEEFVNTQFAFPFEAVLSSGATLQTSGMTLRDYFAGQYMLKACEQIKLGVSRAAIAEDAYAMADVLLEERDK